MNYREMQMPFTTVPFAQMSRKQAMQYLNWYIKTLDERITYLENYVIETGGNFRLDYTPKSLKPLWEWFMPRMEVIPMTPEEIRAEMVGLEPWMEDCILEHTEKISSDTGAIMYDITAYCGQVIIKNIPGIYWGCLCKPKSLIGVNEPRLLGFPHKLSAYLWGRVDACRLKSMENPNSSGLYGVYEICKEMRDF